MFIGLHNTFLDAKHRLAFPAQYKGMLAEGVYVTQGFDRNLLLLSCDAFEIVARQIKGMNMADPLARLLFRMILGSATRLELDKSNSVLLPQNLLEFANIKTGVTLVGQGNYFELWTPELWKEQENSLNNVEANSHRFASLAISTG